METPDTVTVIDYEILYRNGAERRFSLFPTLGDTEEYTPTHLQLVMKKGALSVALLIADMVEVSRHTRQIRILQPTYEPQAKKALVASES